MKQKLENHAMENNKKLPHDLLAAYLNLSESERKDRALSGKSFFFLKGLHVHQLTSIQEQEVRKILKTSRNYISQINNLDSL